MGNREGRGEKETGFYPFLHTPFLRELSVVNVTNDVDILDDQRTFTSKGTIVYFCSGCPFVFLFFACSDCDHGSCASPETLSLLEFLSTDRSVLMETSKYTIRIVTIRTKRGKLPIPISFNKFTFLAVFCTPVGHIDSCQSGFPLLPSESIVRLVPVRYRRKNVDVLSQTLRTYETGTLVIFALIEFRSTYRCNVLSAFLKFENLLS